MMRSRWVAAAALLFAVCFAAPALAVGFAVGGYGVYHFPIVQDDAGNGGLYGAKAKVGLGQAFVLEPSITFISVGEKDHTEDDLDFTTKGGSIRTFGLNLNVGGFPLAPGPSFYVTGGIGSYTLKPDVDYKDDETRVGYNAGLGIAIKATPLFDIDVSGRFIVIPLDGGGSRKSVGLFTGLNFYFGV
ncbi:MAG: outer membrane beta-barrel protein [Candidatus Eisenbacteria bacterium]